MSQHDDYAFFDVDGTITTHNTMLPFLHYCVQNLNLSTTQYMAHYCYRLKLRWLASSQSRNALNALYYQQFNGMKTQDVLDLGKAWFELQLKQDQPFFNPKVVDALKTHQRNGLKIVLVSGGFPATIAPIATYLNVDDYLCVHPVINHGLYTGKISGIQTIGQGKVLAIKTHYQDVLDFSASHAYGDHSSDFPMLNLMGHPHWVGAENEENLTNLTHQYHII